MGKIISISNHKGGVGKTTSAINIGCGFAQKGKKVLLIDLDPQANLTQSLKISDVEISIYENLRGEKQVVPMKYKNNVYVIPSSLDLSAAEIELSAEPGREYILKELLNPLKNQYDVILIDCPPSLGLLTINALTSSSGVIIPLVAEYLPLRGLAKLNDIITKIQGRMNPSLEIGAVFLTQFDSRKVLNRDVSESIRSFFGEKLMETTISNNITLAEAPAQGKDIFLYNKSCKGAKDYEALCSELINKKVI